MTENENSVTNEEQKVVNAPAETAAAQSAENAPVEPIAEGKNTSPASQLAWPEDVSFSKEAIDAFVKLAADLHLPPEQAQQLIDFEARFARQTLQDNAAQQAKWAQETQTFFGPAWQEEVSLAVRAADTFGGPELRALLEETGLGNHPVIVRTFNEIGKRISEDVSSGGNPSAGADKTFTEALYGN